MPTMTATDATTPQISLTLRSFADDPVGWEPMIELARIADRVGLDRLALSDHVVFGEELDAYGDPAKGGTAGGRQPTGPDGHWLDPLTTIAHLTAITSRVRFCTNILLAALRRPVVLAKTVSTIDVLSHQRLDLGVGVGWQRAEYDAAGLDFARRGALLDETLEILTTLWTTDRAAHHGATLSFDGIHQYPKPAGGGVPIWVSGTVQTRSMARLARFGSVWIPWGADAADLAASIPRMREAVAAQDRDPAGIGVVANVGAVRDDAGAIDLDATLASVPSLHEAGATDFRMLVPVPADPAEAEDLLGDMVTRFRARTG
jgi:probable F420-dependent oxidoreductase